MILDILVTGTTVAVAYGAGFLLGKTDRKLTAVAEENEEDGAEYSENDADSPQDGSFGKSHSEAPHVMRYGKETYRQEVLHRERSRASQERLPAGAKKIMLGRAIGSPVTGEVSFFHEGVRKGAIFHSSQGKLYAPASGKIVRLYPTGNCMRLRTEFGVELLLQAGIQTEELEGMHYRPRVVQNEVVTKGKLLLEYDPAAIRLEGYDPSVLMSVEDAEDYRDITVSDAERVQSGDDIMWVRR